MDLSIGIPFLESAAFGLFFSFLYYLIIGPVQPWPWRSWLAGAVVLAGLCYVILFGLVG